MDLQYARRWEYWVAQTHPEDRSWVIACVYGPAGGVLVLVLRVHLHSEPESGIHEPNHPIVYRC